jgi:hypothetical protein
MPKQNLRASKVVQCNFPSLKSFSLAHFVDSCWKILLFRPTLPDNGMLDPNTIHGLLVNATLDGESLSVIQNFAEDPKKISFLPFHSTTVSTYCSLLRQHESKARRSATLKTTDEYDGPSQHNRKAYRGLDAALVLIQQHWKNATKNQRRRDIRRAGSAIRQSHDCQIYH